MRVKGIFRPSDYPGNPAEAEALFAALCPGMSDPQIDRDHAGLAIAAHQPRLALLLSQLSRFLALDTGWGQRADLRELAIQTVNLHFGCGYGFAARMRPADAAWLSAEMLAALPFWRHSPLFDAEQRLVIEYAHAVASGDVPAPLFARIRDAYGERGAVECTSIIALWSFWAMMLNAMGPDRAN